MNRKASARDGRRKKAKEQKKKPPPHGCLFPFSAFILPAIMGEKKDRR